MWLYNLLKDLPEDKWSDVVLAYDNMCHLDGLRAAQRPLPLPHPYDMMWQKITKVFAGSCMYCYYSGSCMFTV